MSPDRTWELVSVASVLVLAGVIAILARPLPPLQAAVDNEAWTRGIEFGLLVFAGFVVLASVGVLRSKITVGVGGVSAERNALDSRASAATQLSAEASQHLAERVRDLTTIVELLVERHQELDQRIDVLFTRPPPRRHTQQAAAEVQDG